MMIRKLLSSFIAAIVFLGLVVNLTRSVDADDLASVSGIVQDASGAVVPAVKITLINDRLGLQRGTVTNGVGSFEVPFLPGGVYTLTAEMPGFATLMVIGLEAHAGVDRKIIITLQPRGVAETIKVQAGQAGINLTDATLKYSITSEQLQNHPVIAGVQGRNVLETIPFLVPGILPGFSHGTRGEGLSVNGARPVSNVFTIDGGDNNDYELNKAASPFPNPDAIQEVKVTTHNYNADVSGGNGGIFDAVVKSGSNKLHGNLRYFFSTSSLNAGDFFYHKKGLTGFDTFGGQLGGPVIIPGLYNGRNRSHFFVDYEGNRQVVHFGSLTGVLSQSERLGDFSSLPPPGSDDQRTTQPIDPLTGEPFPGGRIPDHRIDPIARLYLERFMPPPNFGERGFQQLLSWAQHNRQLAARVDHNINDADRLSATYFRYLLNAEGGWAEVPVGMGTDHNVNHNLTIRESHLFSPRTLNELSGTLSYYVASPAFKQPGFTGIDPLEAGFTGIRLQDSRFLVLPSVEIRWSPSGLHGPYSRLGMQDYSWFADRRKTTIALKDDLSHVAGGHTISFGGGVRAFRFHWYTPSNDGAFSFDDYNPHGTGNGVADFLLGLPFDYYQTTGNKQDQRQMAYAAYFMDAWRARSTLTINAGLRYELAPPVTDRHNQVTVFRPGARSERFPLAPVGQLFAGDPDPVLGRVPRGGYPTDKNNFAPRLGVAYSPSAAGGLLRWLVGENKTSIRSGFGVYYGATYGASFSELASGSPFSFLESRGPYAIFGERPVGTFSNPWGSDQNPFPLPLNERSTADTLVGYLQRSIRTFDPRFRSAYTYQYSLSIQRELPGSLLLELSYAGSNSFKLDRERDLNPRFPDPQYPGRPVVKYPFLFMTAQESSGRASYNSFQVRVSKRLKSGLLFDGSYVIAKSLDNASSPYSGLQFRDLSQSDALAALTDPFAWGRSSFDRHHAFVVSYTYYIPSPPLNGVARRLASGWVIGGYTQLVSGSPVEIYGQSNNFSSFSFSRPDIVGSFQRFDPHQERTFSVNGVPVTGHFFFDPTVFRRPVDGREGNLGRNVFDGPGLNITSVSLAKRVPIVSLHEIEFRGDILNLFNHTNFGMPNSYIGSQYFGTVDSAGTGRTVQLSIRYRF